MHVKTLKMDKKQASYVLSKLPSYVGISVKEENILKTTLCIGRVTEWHQGCASRLVEVECHLGNPGSIPADVAFVFSVRTKV
jgi:hypothetical protein